MVLLPVKGTANLFGKYVLDAFSEAVILSRTASLVWHIQVLMLNQEKPHELMAPRFYNVPVDWYSRVLRFQKEVWIMEEDHMLKGFVQANF